MKSVDYKGMSDEQLVLSLKDLVKNLFHLRFQSATDRLETPSEIRKAKKEIARVKTFQRERAILKERALSSGVSSKCWRRKTLVVEGVLWLV